MLSDVGGLGPACGLVGRALRPVFFFFHLVSPWLALPSGLGLACGRQRCRVRGVGRCLAGGRPGRFDWHPWRLSAGGAS
ncbi:hypothetical protein B0H16DRAFT_1549534 [Mycena metata]|uniref:Uncharacterized protein n=1 Tax=Mycena metata TaxID=1033252 RepID=A0AAD7IU38_9AGAR|nr:hypothetical protein B0H16DRAFT_1549534 [Mycena metata]